MAGRGKSPGGGGEGSGSHLGLHSLYPQQADILSSLSLCCSLRAPTFQGSGQREKSILDSSLGEVTQLAPELLSTAPRASSPDSPFSSYDGSAC